MPPQPSKSGNAIRQTEHAINIPPRMRDVRIEQGVIETLRMGDEDLAPKPPVGVA